MRYIIHFYGGSKLEVVASEVRPLGHNSLLAVAYGGEALNDIVLNCDAGIKKILDDHARQVYPEHAKYLDLMK